MAHSVDGSPLAKGECMRCGFKYELRDIRKEWSGARVCPECWDPKPPQTKPPRIVPEGLPKPGASPETIDRFVGINEITKDDL